MPSDHCVGHDHDKSLLPTRPELSGNDPEQFVERTESWPTASSLQNHELLAKGQIFEQDVAAAAEKPQKQTRE